MDNINSDLTSPSPIADNDIPMGIYDSLPNIEYGGSHMNRAMPHGFEQSQQYVSHALNLTGSYTMTDFDLHYTHPNPPAFVEEGTPDDEWSQHLHPASDYLQDPEDNGFMQSFEGAGGNIASVFNTIHHDSPPQPSPPVPLHAFHSPGSQTIQSPDPKCTSLPPSTPATASRTPSPPDNEGRSPNTRETRYNCTDCGTSSKTKRDHERHLTTKKHQKKTSNGSGSRSGSRSGSASPTVPGFHCLAQGCEYSHEGGKTFTREDNLWRHMKTVHHIKARG